VEPKALDAWPNAGVDPKAVGVPPNGEGAVEPKGELPNADAVWPNAGVVAGLPKTEEVAAPKAGVDWPKVPLPKALEVGCPNAEEDCGWPNADVLYRWCAKNFHT
jgi:hypothetical protein